jgi:DNA-binding NtrC family response regulator
MVQEGHFREDLWYRLAVFPIIIPPLHERPEDIEPLARHLVQRAAHRLGVPTPPVLRSDVEKLLGYRWPGNVRELGSVLERAVILGHGHALDLESALGAQHNRRVSGMRNPAADPPATAHDGSLEPLDTVISAPPRQSAGRCPGSHRWAARGSTAAADQPEHAAGQVA